MVDFNPHTPRSYIVYAWSVFLAGWAAFAISLTLFPPTVDLRLLLVMAGAALSEFFRLSLPAFAWSLTYPLSMSAAVLGGPSAACLVSLMSSVSLDDIREKKPVSILVFNTGQLLVSSALGGIVYIIFGGRILLTASGSYLPLGVSDFPGTLVGMVAAAIASITANMLLTSIGVSLYRGISIRRLLHSGLALVPSQIALAFVGYLMAQILAIAAVALPLFVFPLVIGRDFYQRYVDLRDAYRDTIQSLVGALEAKDSYTRGHSVRVADYAIQIGKVLDFDDGVLEQLEYAALMHDLGKLSLPSYLLTKPAALSDEEMRSMRNHPVAGAEMVAKIPPLRNLTQQIRAHHEWFNGGGYPLGTSDGDIPLLARVLSVADAYDAMTTNRAYRAALDEKAALDEIRAGRGTQFDPLVVDAFLEARGCIGSQETPTTFVART